MNELIKIRDVSVKYDITARALKYYEDMGLISSTRSGDYAYRMYDEATVKKIEQILILRKLNISIKDIKRIFDTSGSAVVLEVLGQKVSNIDEEVALLHELKDIILDFIHQIEQADFSKDADVKLLYDKAKEIETQIVNVDYDGNPSNVNRLLEVTDKLRKPPQFHVIKIPSFRAVTSGPSSFDSLFSENGFSAWINSHLHLIDPFIFDAHDFMWSDSKAVYWIYKVKDGVTEADTAPYQIIDFDGGIYATTVSIDNFMEYDMMGKIYEDIMKWMEGTGFELREHPVHGSHMTTNMIYPHDHADEIMQGLGYEQLELYVPIKVRGG